MTRRTTLTISLMAILVAGTCLALRTGADDAASPDTPATPSATVERFAATARPSPEPREAPPAPPAPSDIEVPGRGEEFSVDAESMAEAIRSEDGSTLFQYLFAKSAGSILWEIEVWRAIVERFGRAYPTFDPEEQGATKKYERELSARVGILKALRNANLAAIDPTQAGPVKAFLQNVATSPSEHWLVKRQALQDLGAAGLMGTEEERGHLLANVDRRAVATAAMSEEEILDMQIDASND